jgi:hypothetical protein
MPFSTRPLFGYIGQTSQFDVEQRTRTSKVPGSPHLDNLYERFKPHAKNVIVLKGAMKASERRLAEELMAKPADEERLILATGQFLGEGFDDNRLDALFMTMPTVWEGKC